MRKKKNGVNRTDRSNETDATDTRARCQQDESARGNSAPLRCVVVIVDREDAD